MTALKNEIKRVEAALAHTERELSNLEDYGDGFGGYDDELACELQDMIVRYEWMLEELTEMLG